MRAKKEIKSKAKKGKYICIDLLYLPLPRQKRTRSAVHTLQSPTVRSRGYWSIFFSCFHGPRTKSRSVVIELPWVAEVFLAGAGEFSVLAEGRHIFGRRTKPREKTDLTETGNRARKVSGTQGIIE